MPHSNRPMMNPQPRHTFDQVYNLLNSMPNKQASLVTTGTRNSQGVEFLAESKTDRDGIRFILAGGSSRIFSCCWGNRNNHYASGGTRIGHYASPLDEWVSEIM